MWRRAWGIGVLVAVIGVAHLWAPAVLSSRLLAQGPEPMAVTAQHEWLKQFVGHWESKSEMPAVGDAPACNCSGSIRSRMLGDLWVVSEFEGDMGGTKMQALQTIGYDPGQQRYVGTWIDSVMGHQWQYVGSVDESGKKLTLEATGPSMAGDGSTALYRDAYEFVAPDHMLVSSSVQQPDGQWLTFMQGTARKQP